jgi:uncharacterized protein YhbP (UPF0306 family)
MEHLNTEALEYLATQRIGVLAIEMLDGSPHAAALHFAHTENPAVFYIATGVDSRKSEALLKNGSSRATFVVGADENNMKTFQADGIARVVDASENEAFMEVYLRKFPKREGRVKDAKALLMVFTPTWWRFTDWKTPEGVKIWKSK